MLNQTSYTFSNAMLWGLCKEHLQKASPTSASGLGHLALGVLEAIPVVGQLVSGVECLIGRFTHKSAQPPKSETGIGTEARISQAGLGSIRGLPSRAPIPEKEPPPVTASTNLSEHADTAASSSSLVESESFAIHTPSEVEPTGEGVVPLLTDIRLNGVIRTHLSEAIGKMEGRDPVPENFQHGLTPLHPIAVGGGLNIALSNDEVREALSKAGASADVGGVIQEAVSAAGIEKGNMLGMGPLSFPTLERAPGLIVTVNGQVRSDNPDLLNPHPSVTREGIEHFQYPISETDEAYEVAFGSREMAQMFHKMDEALNRGEDILIHCNQGEHRSAACLVLYLASRSEQSFESAWRYVQAQRSHIKPYDSGRTTLMTTAYQYWQQNMKSE